MIKGFDEDRFHEKFADHGACGVVFGYFFAEPGAQNNRNILPKIFDTAGQNISGHVGHCHIGDHQVKGPGYPEGLAGDQIPLGAKILAVADCFDAITTTRSHQAARSTEKALEILKKISGNHLDPSLVETFSEEIRKNGLETNT